MIRVEALWLCALPLDMRAGIQTLLARVIEVFVPRIRITPTCLPTGVVRA